MARGAAYFEGSRSMAGLRRQQRLALAVKTFLALKRGDPDTVDAALGRLYDELDPNEPAGAALNTALAERALAARSGASAENLRTMAGVCAMALIAWAGVDRDGFLRAVEAARPDGLRRA